MICLLYICLSYRDCCALDLFIPDLFVGLINLLVQLVLVVVFVCFGLFCWFLFVLICCQIVVLVI